MSPYMIRIARQYDGYEINEHRFDTCFKNNIVAVGWSAIDFTDPIYKNNSTLEEKIWDDYDYSNVNPRVAGKWLAAVRRFRGIQKDDVIVIPYYNCVRFARSKGTFRYDPDVSNDISNQLEVEYYMKENTFFTLSRKDLSEGLQRRLRMQGATVLDLSAFEDEINSILNSQGKYSYTSALIREEEKERDIFENKLLENIQNGNTNLEAGGQGLQELVVELFKCEGYDVSILSKKATLGSGDIDIQAVKTDKFMADEPKMMAVQIKHHSGISDDGISQLINAREQYADYDLVLVTSAELSDEGKQRVNEENIFVVNGKDLARWIYDNIDNLKPETLQKLRISVSPRIL